MDKQDYTDLMIDIETLGTGNQSAIISIAAVKFNIETGETGREFHENIDLKDCLKHGLKVEAETLKWWLEQNRQVFSNCLKDGLPLVAVLFELKTMFKNGMSIWANSPNFDLRILNDAYQAVNLEPTWKFYQERDVRTLVSLAPEVREETEFKGDEHNPLDDCYFQIECVHKAYKKLTKTLP